MKRTTLFLCAAVIAVPGVALAEWSDNFDSYDTVGTIPSQSDWVGWADDATAAEFYASTDQSISGANSLAANEGDDCVYLYSDYTEGCFGYTAWQFIPSDADTDKTYFILLNGYDGGGDLTNWSMQVGFDPVLGTIESEFEGSTLPLVTGQWMRIYNIINLDDDVQTIYYGDDLLVSKSWAEGVSGGGELNIAAVDLWANNTTYTTYYDDMSLTVVPPEGACCYLDGTCTDATSEADCAFAGGVYHGCGSSCSLVFCPELGDCGWILPCPINWDGDTTDEEDSCDLSSGARDAQFELILPYDAEWTISVCDAGWDTILYLGTECCTDDVAESDDHVDCGASSKIVQTIAAGTYFLTVEGYSSSDYGAFPLEISSPCEVECEDGSIAEGEEDCYDFYEDIYNSGCNDDGTHGYPFTEIECNTVICGTAGIYAGTDGTLRDTDWYEFPLDEPTPITVGTVGEFGVQLILMAPEPGFCESGDDVPQLGSVHAAPCEYEEITRFWDPGDVNVGWIWAGPEFFDPIIPVDCGSIYNLYLTCEIADPCPEDITGPDGTPDGVVDVLDLLLVLSQWDTTGPEADITGPDGEPDGVVDVLDLLAVLGAWGDC